MVCIGKPCTFLDVQTHLGYPREQVYNGKQLKPFFGVRDSFNVRG